MRLSMARNWIFGGLALCLSACASGGAVPPMARPPAWPDETAKAEARILVEMASPCRWPAWRLMSRNDDLARYTLDLEARLDECGARMDALRAWVEERWLGIRHSTLGASDPHGEEM